MGVTGFVGFGFRRDSGELLPGLRPSGDVV